MLCRLVEWNGWKPIGPHAIITFEIMHCTALQWLLVVNGLLRYLGGKCIVYSLSLQFTVVA